MPAITVHSSRLSSIRIGLPSVLLSTPLPSPEPYPRCLPDGGVAETREATSFEVASFIFGAGKKERLKFVWGLR
ncbi:uncharacterized protein METZ01_LOCUS153293 [marine metagenome]|uniref:Uncharacterized protein n=1 Tax=marine metagenome TaxID=408172 RepID=A0A382AGF0_9ZZZZ